MLLAKIIGTATATTKHPSLDGWRLLVAQPLMQDGTSFDGDPQLAIDHLGIGVGQTAILTSDGKMTRELVKDDSTPVRWSVMGVVNE
jgi:ethanolamine utilization protein EutN